MAGTVAMSSTPEPLTITKTSRGFDLIEFTDRNGVVCSLQKSSAAMEDCIWLGVHDHADDRPDRMHLTRSQVAALMPHLQRFLDEGEIVECGEASEYEVEHEQASPSTETGFALSGDSEASGAEQGVLFG